MRKIYSVVLLLVAMTVTISVSAQQNNWSSRSAETVTSTDKAVARLSFPREFKVFALSIEPLKQKLFSIVDKQAHPSTIITLPNADGGYEQFEVYEASNFEPALQAQFPEIRAYSGRGITDRYATLKLSISPQGIQTMVFRTERENEFIEPYSSDHRVYAVFKSQRQKGKLNWTCTTEDQQMYNSIDANIPGSQRTQSNTGELKTIRLAQSCNGEYSNWFGAFNSGQVALVLAAFNATLTRCNGCYEKDLALHLNLIAGTTAVIFYDPATDPYTTLGQWNAQLQATLTSIIGEANYDLGHMFGASGGGGNAGCIGCVCVDGQKGRGITSPADGIPQGDNFDIDYVVHEVGHQLGGNHTFSHGLEGTGQNKEVGAGITIMGYAGITAYDPAPHSIDIYHETSIAQIQANLATKSCPTNFVMGANNNTPVVAPVSNYTIPISTPFILIGSATDANGDPLTYCWEQNDNATTSGANSVASPAKLTGPNWLSFSPTVSPSRTFPRLSTILAGLQVTPPLPGGDAICNIEALSSVSRTLNFRLTVRDNCPYVPGVKIGQTAFTDMAVTVNAAGGPFEVTAPNTSVILTAGFNTTVTWSVNGTDQAPFNATNVKISLSTDGGTTFPTVLAASTPNDGTQSILIPCGMNTTTGRIKIEAIGNIFFDINNTNFTIQNGFDFDSPAPVNSGCPVPNTIQIPLGTLTACGFNSNITLSPSGNPAGTSVTFGTNPVVPGNNTTVNVTGTASLAAGTYTFTVIGTASGAQPVSRDVSFIIAVAASPNITNQPQGQTLCAGSNASFSVIATGGNGYQWQISTGGGPFTDIPGATAATYNISGVTTGMNGNQYRVVVTASCASPTTSNAATLNVVAPAAISGQPTNKALCSGGNTTFTATATGATIYQWQVNTGSGFTDLGNTSPYSGVNTNTLTITGATAVMNTYQYRLKASNATCTTPVISNAGTLTVHALPTITLTATKTSLLPGQISTLTATPSANTPGSSTIATAWAFNGTPFTNATNTYVVDIEHTGAYQVGIAETWTDGSVCVNTSASVAVDAQASPKLFIFPNPNDGQFTVAYYNNGGSSTNRTVTVYDSKGAMIHQQKFSIAGPYTLLHLDVRPALTGMYIVMVSDAGGKKLAEGRVLIH